MNNYKSLVKLIKISNEPLDVEDLGIHSLMHYFFLNNESKLMKDFSDSLALFYYRVYGGYSEFGGAFMDSREDLDKYSKEADAFFNIPGEINAFYRDSVFYIDESEAELN